MKLSRLKSLAGVAVALALAGCASPIAVVSQKTPARFQVTSGTDQAIAQAIERAQKVHRAQPLVALEAYASAARDALRDLERNPADKEARRSYNFAVAGIFSVVRAAKLNPWTQAIPVGAGSELILTGKNKDPRPDHNPSLYELIPTEELNFRGSYVKDDVKKEGIGAPLVAVRQRSKEEAAAAFGPRGIYYSVTGVAEFEGSRCVLSIHDPLASETAQVKGRTYPWPRILPPPWRCCWLRKNRKNWASSGS
jgi:hypothetical protein